MLRHSKRVQFHRNGTTNLVLVGTNCQRPSPYYSLLSLGIKALIPMIDSGTWDSMLKEVEIYSFTLLNHDF
tara:strand:+ start:20211 stop:20423 length:213 start_codon:yes stop_codon:yes gene_type:complete